MLCRTAGETERNLPVYALKTVHVSIRTYVKVISHSTFINLFWFSLVIRSYSGCYFCWHCLHSVRQGLCNDTMSVHPSVQSCTAAMACGQFAAVGPMRRRYRSIAAQHICSRHSRLSLHIHSSTVVSSKCEQCHVYSDVGSWTQTGLSCVRRKKQHVLWSSKPCYQQSWHTDLIS